MKPYNKCAVALLGTLLSFFYSTQCLAQSGMNNVRSDKPREDKGPRWVQMNNHWVLMNNNNKVDDILLNWNKASGKHKYQVTFKDSSIKETISYMYTDTISQKLPCL